MIELLLGWLSPRELRGFDTTLATLLAADPDDTRLVGESIADLAWLVDRAERRRAGGQPKRAAVPARRHARVFDQNQELRIPGLPAERW